MLVLWLSCNQAQKNTIGVLFPHLEANSRWAKEAGYLKEHGSKQQLEILVKSAGKSSEHQLQQADSLIDAGAGVLIVAPVNSNKAGEIVRRAHANNVKVLAYGRTINNATPDYYVSYNVRKIGEAIVGYALNEKPAGNYVILSPGRPAGSEFQLFHECADEYAKAPHQCRQCGAPIQNICHIVV